MKSGITKDTSVLQITKSGTPQHMILLYGPHCTKSLCGPQHPRTSINKCSPVFSFNTIKTRKHTKENHEIFCHCVDDLFHAAAK